MIFPKTPLMPLYTDANHNRVFVKRDDLLPFSFGGNKARIAWEYVEDMRQKGKNHMIAYGNARSNLCRALSNLCAGESIPCTVLSPANDDGSREDSYNFLLSRYFGAEVVPCLKTGVAQAVERALAASEAKGLRPYYVNGNIYGTGNLETPVRAYRKVWDELRGQENELGAPFDEIYLAVGTGMTLAGLCCGQAETGGEEHFIGISIARPAQAAAEHVRAYMRAFSGKDADVCVLDRYALSYGGYTPAMARLAAEAMRLYGLPLDLTYTGKAFYGMTQELLAKENRRVLFLHTGGTPLFFDKARELFAR